LIPVYGAAEKLDTCLASLGQYAPAGSHIFVLDDGTPDGSVAECCRRHAISNLTYVRSDVNRGFVATCNWGYRDVAPAGNDILLLNSDTELTAGCIEEMQRVLYLHERHGVVCPRSNNATIFSIPKYDPKMPPSAAYEIWRQIRANLPEYSLMPTAVGFCMLVKRFILDRFGLFDEVYNPGYNEENDFVCRINRYGYSTVAANRAFVFHYESSTFGARRVELERQHREILLERYPEFEKSVSEYGQYGIDPVERFSVLLLPRRQAILYDVFHLSGKHSGTSEFALNLLRELYPLLRDEFDVHVGLSEEGRFFAPDLNGYALFEDRPGSDSLFDLAFKPCQLFTWAEFRRMNRVSPRVCFVLQDIIAVRCNYLTSVDRNTLFERTAELADHVFSISSYTLSDFNAFYHRDLEAKVIHHGTNLGLDAAESGPGEHILLMGNRYAHKGVKDALPYMADMGPVAVLGGEPPNEPLPATITWRKSGSLTRTQMRLLFAKASILVYPSHYEGYGLPIADALALGKPVIALDTELNRELRSSMNDPDLHLIPSLQQLPVAVKAALQNSRRDSKRRPEHVRRWKHVAEDYAAAIRELIRTPPNPDKMRARSELFRVMDASRHP
jgi:GT2 family glycosyltransferase